MKRNPEPFSHLVIPVDDVIAIRTARTVPLDIFRLQLIVHTCRPPARPHAASFIRGILITLTNHSKQDMFSVVVGGGLKGSCRRASRRRPDLRALRRRQRRALSWRFDGSRRPRSGEGRKVERGEEGARERNGERAAVASLSIRSMVAALTARTRPRSQFVKLQSAISLKCGQQGRDHNLEPLAAHSIRCLPQCRQEHSCSSHRICACALAAPHCRPVRQPCVAEVRAPHACGATPSSRIARRVCAPSPPAWPTRSVAPPPTPPRAARPC